MTGAPRSIGRATAAGALATCNRSARPASSGRSCTTIRTSGRRVAACGARARGRHDLHLAQEHLRRLRARAALSREGAPRLPLRAGRGGLRRGLLRRHRDSLGAGEVRPGARRDGRAARGGVMRRPSLFVRRWVATVTYRDGSVVTTPVYGASLEKAERETRASHARLAPAGYSWRLERLTPAQRLALGCLPKPPTKPAVWKLRNRTVDADGHVRWERRTA